jgi:hypothetical protein
MNAKFSFILLLLALVALVGCSTSEDVPPEPNGVGGVGNFYVSIGQDWVTEPESFYVIEDNLECAGEETVSFEYKFYREILTSFSGDKYVYDTIYLWNESSQEWVAFDMEGERYGYTSYLQGAPKKIMKTISLTCDQALELADTDSLIYAVSYTCDKRRGDWDCHDNKWQLQALNLTQRVDEVLDDVADDVADDTPSEVENPAEPLEANKWNVKLPEGYVYTYVNESNDCVKDGDIVKPCKQHYYNISNSTDVVDLEVAVTKYGDGSKNAKRDYEAILAAAFAGEIADVVPDTFSYNSPGQSRDKEYLRLVSTVQEPTLIIWRSGARYIVIDDDQLLFEAVANKYPANKVYIDVPVAPVTPDSDSLDDSPETPTTAP